MLVASLKTLAVAGADFAVIASNTPHVVFDEVRALSPLPLISIVEETCKKAWSLQYKKVGLLGTGFTMQGAFYPDCFATRGMEVVVPQREEQGFIHEKIYTELVFGDVRSDTKKRFLAITERMVREQQIEALILGCTELPLIITGGDSSIPLLNTVEIHVDSIVAMLTPIISYRSKGSAPLHLKNISMEVKR